MRCRRRCRQRRRRRRRSAAPRRRPPHGRIPRRTSSPRGTAPTRAARCCPALDSASQPKACASGGDLIVGHLHCAEAVAVEGDDALGALNDDVRSDRHTPTLNACSNPHCALGPPEVRGPPCHETDAAKHRHVACSTSSIRAIWAVWQWRVCNSPPPPTGLSRELVVMPMPKRTSVDDYFAQLNDHQRPHLEDSGS